mgnify:CR=1 FL=1
MKNKNIVIKKVMLFDDKPFDNEKDYMKGIREVMLRSFGKIEYLRDWIISDDVIVELYSINQNGGRYISSDSFEEEALEWFNDLNKLFFSNEVGYLILCDYAWEEPEYKEARDKIYEAVCMKENVIYVCYSTIFPESAQQWLDMKVEQEHACVIVDTALTIPRMKVYPKLRSLEEAMLDEW